MLRTDGQPIGTERERCRVIVIEPIGPCAQINTVDHHEDQVEAVDK